MNLISMSVNNPSPKPNEDRVIPFNYPIIRTRQLSKPLLSYNSNFFELTRLRRSEKLLAKLTEQQLSDLLWFSAKVIDTHYQENGYVLSRRPSPSAGARHPIDLLIVSPASNAYIQYYNPFEHSLSDLKINENHVEDFIDHINQNMLVHNGTVIWFIVYINRTSAKYNDPLSLIWRDAGALLQILQMTATAMGLNSCPFGTLADPFIDLMFDSPTIVSGGGIIMGNNLQL